MITKGERDYYYDECMKELESLIPAEEQERILNQEWCELEDGFWGFVDIYKPLSLLIPKSLTIIDFGCYLAAQAYYFKDHKKYIGVDTVELERFKPENAEHYVGTIQQFIKDKVPQLFSNGDYGNLDYFAICSYVPDFEGTELVRKTFKNVICYYPSRNLWRD